MEEVVGEDLAVRDQASPLGCKGEVPGGKDEAEDEEPGQKGYQREVLFACTRTQSWEVVTCCAWGESKDRGPIVRSEYRD